VPYYQRLFQNHDGKRQWNKVSHNIPKHLQVVVSRGGILSGGCRGCEGNPEIGIESPQTHDRFRVVWELRFRKPMTVSGLHGVGRETLKLAIEIPQSHDPKSPTNTTS
jgi:hypothetical protein